MAISYVGTGQGSSSPNTGITLNYPGSLATNDLLLVAAAVGDTADNGIPTPGGWTNVGAVDLYANATNDVCLDLWYQYWTSGTSVALTATGGTNASNAAIIMAFRGVRLAADGGPFDTTPSTATGTGSSNADPPSHDWSGTAGVWTVILGATGHTGGVGAFFTFPTGYTLNANYIAHDDTIDVLLGMGFNQSPSDPENPGAFTAGTIGTAANNAWAAATLSLRPAAAPAGGDDLSPAGQMGYYGL